MEDSRLRRYKFENPPDTGPIILPSATDVFQQAVKEGDIQRALEINPTYPRKDSIETDLPPVIEQCLIQTLRLEEAARSPVKWQVPPDVVQMCPWIIRFSAPGDERFHEKPARRKDRYFGKPWAWDLDHNANDDAGRLDIVMKGISANIDMSVFAKDGILSRRDPILLPYRQQARSLLASYDAHIFYIGRGQGDEGAAVRATLASPDSFVPIESVQIIEKPKTDNTMNQCDDLRGLLDESMASGAIKVGQGIVLVDFAPRLMRITRHMKRYKTIPPGIQLYLFPIATPNIAQSKLPEWEARAAGAGYIIREQIAATPCDYKVFGEWEGHPGARDCGYD